MSTNLKPKEWLSTDELVRWLGSGRTKTYEMLRSGEIPSYRWGRRRLIRRRDVEAWLEANRYVPGNNS
jgi:excisionase family DNA binding protein